MYIAVHDCRGGIFLLVVVPIPYDFGDKIVVSNGREYVVPARDDLNAIYTKEETIDEDEAKRLLGV